MPRPASYPTFIDECLSLSISELVRWKYLKPGQYMQGTITWSRGEGASREITSRIGITVNTSSRTPFIQFDYKCKEEAINYRVDLVFMPSNLGKGLVWFFICPHTQKRCRKLHLIDSYFYHRSAFQGCMYSKQAESHKWRQWDKLFGAEFRADDAYQKIYSRYFKKTYAGKPTKRYKKLIRKAQMGEDSARMDFSRL